MSLAPSLVRKTNLGGTIHMLVGDSNPRYLAELNGSRVYCDDMATAEAHLDYWSCLLYTSPSPRDRTRSRMPSSA